MKRLALLISPAVLCVVFILASVGFSVLGSSESQTILLKQKTKFGFARTYFPVQMHRWDEQLYAQLTMRAKHDMAEFLKGAQQEIESRPEEDAQKGWSPSRQSVRYLEQFRGGNLVSYLEVTSIVKADGERSVAYKTINFDKGTKREIGLGDLLEGAADRSKALDALAAYARADLKERTGEEEESDALLELTRPDLAVYERFTFCPSTRLGKAAGLTIHFAPATSGGYAGNDFHVTIPFTVFAKFLKPGMKTIFSGEPRQAPIDLPDGDA